MSVAANIKTKSLFEGLLMYLLFFFYRDIQLGSLSKNQIYFVYLLLYAEGKKVLISNKYINTNLTKFMFAFFTLGPVYYLELNA